MNNNNIDQIPLQSSKRKVARFNMKHSVDTSCGIGEIQCMMFKEVQPGSNSVLRGHSTIRLDPMVAPTFGELKLHHNFAYVGIDDLFPKFGSLLAQQPTQFGAVAAVPTNLPKIPLKYLSALCLIGSKISVYLRSTASDGTENNVLYSYHYTGTDSYGKPNVSSSVAGETFRAQLNGSGSNLLVLPTPPTVGNVSFSNIFNSYNSYALNIAYILGWSCKDFWVPCREWNTRSMLGFYDDPNSPMANSVAYKTGMFDTEIIGLDSNSNNDVVWRITIQDENGNDLPLTIAAKFSTFGQRMFKLLIGLGYGFDLNSNTDKSLAPLLGLYKSWFDSFAPTLYQGWETTNCAKLLALYDSEGFYQYENLFINPTSSLSVDDALKLEILVGFFDDICNMWYTEEQDSVTMYIRSSAVSPRTNVVQHMDGVTPNVGDVINVTESSSRLEPGVANLTAAQEHAYINTILHSELDSEVLKRLYKVVNRNTIAGRRIKQLLEAQGLGDYIKNCRSNFLGHTSVEIDIFDVTATADTLQKPSGEGMYLGEYVGKGVGDGKLKTFKYHSEGFGYIYDLAAIVPESGWTNSVDAATENITKLDFYNPEYDGLGYEASRKSVVTAVDYSADLDNTSGLDETFGFAPRDSRHKVISNKFNGYFGLHSRQKAYLPYTFNKFVEVGGQKANMVGDSNSPGNPGAVSYYTYPLLTAARLPIASPMYRFVGKYPWMGRFRRIFAALGVDALNTLPQYFDDFSASLGESVKWSFCSLDNDNFVVHNVFLYDYYAPMLPIEDSFETKEEGNNGYTDLAQGKA